MNGVDGAQWRRGDGARLGLLLGDADAVHRSQLAALARERGRLFVVLEAADAADAVEIGLQHSPQIALLDATAVGGVEAALTLRARRPQMRVALQAHDPSVHAARARRHRLPLFDKGRPEDALDWLDLQARTWFHARSTLDLGRTLDLECTSCGYGVVRDAPPPHCPMCHTEGEWLRRRRRSAGRLHLLDAPTG